MKYTRLGESLDDMQLELEVAIVGGFTYVFVFAYLCFCLERPREEHASKTSEAKKTKLRRTGHLFQRFLWMHVWVYVGMSCGAASSLVEALTNKRPARVPATTSTVLPVRPFLGLPG